jgi:lipopolysaccharide kinase (Kdo/WaaP) family protein
VYASSFETNFPPQPEDIIKEEPGTIIWTSVLPAGERIVIKMYRHRGIVNSIRGRVVKYRVEREYDRLRHLADWDVPCTPPVGWTHGYSPERGFYEMLATSLVPDAEDLASWLEQGKSCDFTELFALVRRMHESGFLHHVLYARNILVTGGQSAKRTFLISDLPRSRIFPRSLVGTRLAMLDVADLVDTLKQLEIAPNEIPLEAYGFSPVEIQRISKLIGSYRNTRIRRILRDIESRARHLGAILAAILSGRSITVSRSA